MKEKPLSVQKYRDMYQTKPLPSPRKNKQTEASAQTALSTYVKLKYPDVIFTAESSGIKTSIGQAVKMKANRSEGKLPDFICLEARGGKYGLIMEIKKPEFDLKKALNPDKVGDKHAKAQELVLKKLSKQGYEAVFAVGFNEAKKIIDDYMSMHKSAWPGKSF